MKKVSNIKSKKPTVFVGVSGGVDSSVSAALLQKAGFNVVGVFIKVWTPDFIDCTWKEERLDAMRVCAHLHIPFKTLDLEREYKKEVVDYMVAEYRSGRTPNPDVMCNKHIKFGAFYDWAMKNGADYVATGHYAQVSDRRGLHPSSLRSYGRASADKAEKSKEVGMLASTDKNKDQTYFLWTLPQTKLQKTLFPVGHLKKVQVRVLAKKFSLPTAIKKDSQGLCFMGKVDIKDFLAHFIEKKEGKVIDEKGKVIGRHQGAFYYTLGERHGFDIKVKTTTDKPYYIVSKDLVKNTLTVSSKAWQEKTIGDHKIIYINLLNRINDWPVNRKLLARIRYRQTLEKCLLEKVSDNLYKVKFEQDQNAVALGQSLVLYNKNICLGGGVICAWE